MRQRNQRVDVYEVIIQETLQGGQVAYGLSRKRCWRRKRSQTVGGIVSWGASRTLVASSFEFLSLNGLCMPVGGSATATGAFKGAGDVKGSA
jgi:hypothetical protein